MSAADPAEPVAAGIEAWQRFALSPARLPPPSIATAEQVAVAGDLRATARPVRAEEAVWNQWTDGPRLFNDRAALWFEVRVEGPDPLTWAPERATVEINTPELRIGAAGSAELLLGDLLVHALLEERAGLEGDLVERTRGAGAFRAAYLPPVGVDGRLDGLVAFPLWDGERSLAERHVVALRLVLPVQAGGEWRELVFVFE